MNCYNEVVMDHNIKDLRIKLMFFVFVKCMVFVFSLYSSLYW